MRVIQINPGVRGVATYSLNLHTYLEKNVPAVEPYLLTSCPWIKEAVPGLLEPPSRLIRQIYPWVKAPVRTVYPALDKIQPELLHFHHPLGNLDFHARRIQRRYGVPSLLTIHMAIGAHRYFIDRVMHLYYQMVKGRYRGVDAVVAISEYVRRQVINSGLVPPERVVLLYAGIDTSIFQPLTYTPHDRLEIVFIGQIRPEKGIDIVIDAVKQLKKERPVRLTIVGDGNMREQLQQQTAGNEEIRWVGFVRDRREVARYYAEADLAVMPTRWEEAFSLVPLEAMAAGTAVCASRIGGNCESILDGKTGFLVERGNAEEFYRILQRASIQELWDMGQAGRRRVMEKYTLELFGEKYAHLYRNLAERPGKIDPVE